MRHRRGRRCRRRSGATMRQAVGDDERFEIAGFDERVGFYANFERGLAQVPADAPWVALSDQDDEWMPDKLAVLVPALDHAALVSGQARVVTYPDGVVVAASTHRRSVSAPALVLENQFSERSACSVDRCCRRRCRSRVTTGPRRCTTTGSPSAPRSRGASVWSIGWCRTMSSIPRTCSARRMPLASGGGRRCAVGDAVRAETDARGLRAVARSLYTVNAGWAEAMVDTVAARVDDERALRLAAAFGAHRRRGRTLRTVVAGRGAARSVFGPPSCTSSVVRRGPSPRDGVAEPRRSGSQAPATSARWRRISFVAAMPTMVRTTTSDAASPHTTAVAPTVAPSRAMTGRPTHADEMIAARRRGCDSQARGRCG